MRGLNPTSYPPVTDAHKSRLTAAPFLPILQLTIPAKPRVGSKTPDTAQIGGLLVSGGKEKDNARHFCPDKASAESKLLLPLDVNPLPIDLFPLRFLHALS